MTTEHFLLRPIEVEDASTIADWFHQIEDISIFDRQIPLPLNYYAVNELVRSIAARPDGPHARCRWFLAETALGEAVGMAGLDSIDPLHGNAILPCFIAADWRRCGLGIRLCAMMLDIAFLQLRLHRVSTLYRHDNLSSKSLLSRMGFCEEGISRQAWFYRGEFHDLVNAAILTEEWQRRRQPISTSLSNTSVLEMGPRPSGDWSWPLTSVISETK